MSKNHYRQFFVFAEGGSSRLGVGENPESEIVVRASPNPTTDVIEVDVTLKETSALFISLIDGQGRKLLGEDIPEERTEHHTKLNVTGLTEGIYFLRVTSSQGNITKKVIKH